MQLPRATVTHTIKQLEARLDTRLLQRTTRQVHVTLDGEAYYQRCVQLLADVEEAETALSPAVKPKGKPRVDLQATLACEGVDCVLRGGELRDSSMVARRVALQEVLAEFRPAPMPISVLYPQQRQLSPRVPVFVDWLAELFAGF